jgi:hypothetical protein
MFGLQQPYATGGTPLVSASADPRVMQRDNTRKRVKVGDEEAGMSDDGAGGGDEDSKTRLRSVSPGDMRAGYC